MIIEIFGKDFCPYCDKAVRVAQQFIQETEHKYTYQKLDRDLYFGYHFDDTIESILNDRKKKN